MQESWFIVLPVNIKDRLAKRIKTIIPDPFHNIEKNCRVIWDGEINRLRPRVLACRGSTYHCIETERSFETEHLEDLANKLSSWFHNGIQEKTTSEKIEL